MCAHRDAHPPPRREARGGGHHSGGRRRRSLRGAVLQPDQPRTACSRPLEPRPAHAPHARHDAADRCGGAGDDLDGNPVRRIQLPVPSLLDPPALPPPRASSPPSSPPHPNRPALLFELPCARTDLHDVRGAAVPRRPRRRSGCAPGCTARSSLSSVSLVASLYDGKSRR